MLGLYVTNPWPAFYKKGMKTWEIRSYPTDYRGNIAIIHSHTNKVICQMQLVDCIPLTKERWEMNFEKHRTSCSFEELPYKRNDIAYAWVLANPSSFDNELYLPRPDKKPYHFMDDDVFANEPMHPISFSSERIACKFLGDTMFLYWLRKNYFALVAIVNLNNGTTQLITAEIAPEEIDYMLSQINANE